MPGRRASKKPVTSSGPRRESSARMPNSTRLLRLLLWSVLGVAVFGVLARLLMLPSISLPDSADSPLESGSAGAEAVLPYVSAVEVVKKYPHDPSAFTQGLVFGGDGTLYESLGLYRQSGVRAVDLESGRVLSHTANAPDVFGEGAEVVRREGEERLVQLSWKNRLAFEYNLPNLTLRRTVQTQIGREGWGLAFDGAMLYVTDSGTELFHVDPESYKVVKSVPIIDPKLGGKRIHGVNELEWVSEYGELWGNVYPMYQHKSSECVVRIDASTGQVIGWIDMRGLLAQQRREVRSNGMHYPLNGIAIHPQSHRIYATGKQWDTLFEIKLSPRPKVGPEHVAQACNLG